MSFITKVLGIDKLQEKHKEELVALENSYLDEIATVTESLKSELAAEVSDWESASETERELPTVDRIKLLQQCWNYFCKSPVIRAVVKYTTIFVFGKGITYEIDNADAKAYVDAFYKHHRLDQVQKKLSNELQIYGQLFLYVPESAMAKNDGLSEAATEKEPAKLVREADQNDKLTKHPDIFDFIPIDPAEIEDIETDEFDIRKTVRYKRVYITPKGTQVVDYIPASEIQHISVNNATNSKWGRSDLESIILWTKRYNDFLKNRVLINQAKRAIFFDVEVKGGAVDVAREKAKYPKLPKFGSILFHNEAVKWNVVNPKIEAQDAESDGRMLLRMVAIGALLPEYMLSEARGTTYAASKAQEAPALQKYVDYQDLWESEYETLFRHIIALGVKYEKLPKTYKAGKKKEEKLMADVPIRIYLPELIKRKLLDVAKSMMILLDVGLSKKTIFDIGGYDYEAEQRQRKEEIDAEEQKEFDAGER